MPSPLPMLISMGVVVSTLGAAHGLMSTSSRLSSAAGRRGHLPPALSYVHVRWNAPTLDLMATAALTAPMMALDVAVLVKLFTLTRWIFYGVTMVAFIVLRFTRVSHKQRCNGCRNGRAATISSKYAPLAFPSITVPTRPTDDVLCFKPK